MGRPACPGLHYGHRRPCPRPYTYHTDGTLDFWAAFYFVLVRAGVPLFVMLSSALLLPLRQTTGDFLKRRFMRVALPFIIWSAIFAFLPLPGDLRGYAPQYNFTPAPGSYWADVLYVGDEKVKREAQRKVNP